MRENQPKHVSVAVRHCSVQRTSGYLPNSTCTQLVTKDCVPSWRALGYTYHQLFSDPGFGTGHLSLGSQRSGTATSVLNIQQAGGGVVFTHGLPSRTGMSYKDTPSLQGIELGCRFLKC